MVNQRLLLQNEYLITENRILRAHLPVFLGDPDRFEADLSRHRDASAQDVRDTVAKWLNTRNRLLVRFHPEASERESTEALDRSKPPLLGSDRPFRVPEVQSRKLKNGMDLFVVQRADLPKVAVTLVTRAGSVSDPEGKDGLADLTVTMVKMGTQTRKALEIEDGFGDLGATVGGAADREQASLSFEVLKRNLAPALVLLADVARNPVFPELELEREKKLRLDALAQDAKEPNAIAFRVGSMLAFGVDHPYGRPVRGLPATVQRVTRADFVQFHDEHWKPGSSALILAGDVSLAEATELARQGFRSWSGGAAHPANISKPRPMGPGKVFLVDRQDATQTVVVQILSAPPRKSEEYFALRLVDAVWGGATGARLGLNLREEKGYSYGVFSFPNLYSKSGIWRANGAAQPIRLRTLLSSSQRN